jgi:hypothetical protein
VDLKSLYRPLTASERPELRTLVREAEGITLRNARILAGQRDSPSPKGARD